MIYSLTALNVNRKKNMIEAYSRFGGQKLFDVFIQNLIYRNG